MGPHMGFSREISQAAGQEMWPPKASNPSGKSNAGELQTKSDLMDKLSRDSWSTYKVPPCLCGKRWGGHSKKLGCEEKQPPF